MKSSETINYQRIAEAIDYLQEHFKKAARSQPNRRRRFI
jgi:hypothetical protein